MKIRPYLTFDGECSKAIELYKKAFKTDIIQIMYFEDLNTLENKNEKDSKKRVLQCTLKLGDDFIRLCDCGKSGSLNDSESERLSLAVEANIEEVKYAFDILSKEGNVGIPLEKTFYSPLAGVVFDKFGVMWNFISKE